MPLLLWFHTNQKKERKEGKEGKKHLNEMTQPLKTIFVSKTAFCLRHSLSLSQNSLTYWPVNNFEYRRNGPLASSYLTTQTCPKSRSWNVAWNALTRRIIKDSELPLHSSSNNNRRSAMFNDFQVLLNTFRYSLSVFSNPHN